VFPPALVGVLRDQLSATSHSLADVPDELLVQLLTTVFFAGLETYEGERNPIGVAFLGRSQVDFVVSEGAESGGAFLYQWKVLRFDTPRPFAVRELVTLAVAGVDRRIYSAVRVLDDGQLAIVGLAREGVNGDSDPFVKIVASRPGCLTIRGGRDLLLGYERGTILTGGEDVVFSAGPVRRALDGAARAAGLDETVSDYLNAVRSIVREMAAHGRGGILIISPEEHPNVGESVTYTMARDSSLAALLRLAGRINAPAEPNRRQERPPFAHLLRNALLTEVERVIEEFGALTGIDGALLLNRDLALIAFGVILPVGRAAAIAEAVDAEGTHARMIDLSNRGTRHRASVNYASKHPGSVVFMASEDGQVSCLFRGPSHQQVRLWRLGPVDVGIS
jgi:hypothetical protein